MRFWNVTILLISWPKIILPTACKTKIQGGFDQNSIIMDTGKSQPLNQNNILKF